MNFIEAVLVVLVPCSTIFLPGAFFIRIHGFKNLLIQGARIILWSMGILTIALTAGLYFGIPVVATVFFLCGIGIVNIIRHKKLFFTRQALWYAMAMIIPMLIGLILFSVPFFVIHDGLPTGDVQKTIIWANDSLATHNFPNYTRAISLLNRDPVDFYTPGLHAVASLVISLSPAPLTSISIFAIVIALCVAWIASSLTNEMFDNHSHVAPPILAALFTLTQYRFLRYVREPGYHLQNLVGELFLFGALLLCVRFIRRREKQDAILFLIVIGALFLTHQFSMFIAVFAIATAMVAVIFEYRARIVYAIKLHKHLTIVAIVFCMLGLAIASSLHLSSKLPALFTSKPHLTGLLPSFADYPATMGEVWFFSGIVGIVLMLWDACLSRRQAQRSDEHRRQVIAFASATATILLLSQGPAIGIDIPPVRALFYIVVPFSVGAAYFFGMLFLIKKRLSRVTLFFIIIAVCSSSTYRAYATLSHDLRTNSTLTGEELGLIESLKREKSAILIDDYNRRSASWLVLSDRPMFTRIAADLKQQMEEARQSPLRMQLYLKQLDFEKIFSLGSMPEITSLFAKHGIGAVTGIANSSQTAFMHNPYLLPIGFADDVTVYKATRMITDCPVFSECAFLLRSSTLANDIGDNQDTFEHLQASIRSARLSEPLVQGHMTYRETTASRIPIEFNVGDYVRAIWDPNKINRPEASLRMVIFFTKPYEGLSLRTPSGKTIPLPATKHATVELQQDAVQIDSRGFVTLTVINPRWEPIGIDLVALGLSLIP